MTEIETKLLPLGAGTLESWRAFQEARKKYPGARRFEIDYTGRRPRVIPVYESPRTSTPRASTPAARSQQEELERRLREIAGTFHKLPPVR